MPDRAGARRASGRPRGADFRLWQARNRPGAQLVNAPGAWNFSDLQTSEPHLAIEFYASAFGWEVDDVGFASMIRRPGYGDHLAATVDPGIRDRQSEVMAPPGFEDAVAWVGLITPGSPGLLAGRRSRSPTATPRRQRPRVSAAQWNRVTTTNGHGRPRSATPKGAALRAEPVHSAEGIAPPNRQRRRHDVVAAATATPAGRHVPVSRNTARPWRWPPRLRRRKWPRS